LTQDSRSPGSQEARLHQGRTLQPSRGASARPDFDHHHFTQRELLLTHVSNRARGTQIRQFGAQIISPIQASNQRRKRYVSATPCRVRGATCDCESAVQIEKSDSDRTMTILFVEE
jgi:hypothetical protein